MVRILRLLRAACIWGCMARRAGDSAEVLSLVQLSVGSRRLTELYQPPVSDQYAYHQGTVLSGDIPMSILWYGRFTPAQRSIISDFLLSLTAAPNAATPSVGEWWGTIEQLYLSNAATHVFLAEQVSHEQCSLGRSLTLAQIDQLVGRKMGGVALVFADEDMNVEVFCSSRCGTHGSTPGADSTHTSGSATPSSSARGRSRSRCTGRRARPLVAPKGDVGMDGMVMVLATTVGGTVTNPYGDRFYQGPKDAPLEACTACPGVYGSSACPRYAGN